MSDTCLACGYPTMTARTVPFEFRHGHKVGRIQDSQTVCRTCDTICYVGEQASRHERAVAASIREMDGLLTPEELRDTRVKNGFLPAQLETMLCIAPKTWARWERGKVPQSKAADALIRLLTA